MTIYQSKINLKKWQDRSHHIKTRDNLKCQAYDCRTPECRLEVHHLDYFAHKEPWEYPDDMLITICSKCHDKEKLRYKHEDRLFRVLKMKGFLYCDIVAFTAFLYNDSDFLNSLLNDIRTKKNGYTQP